MMYRYMMKELLVIMGVLALLACLVFMGIAKTDAADLDAPVTDVTQ